MSNMYTTLKESSEFYKEANDCTVKALAVVTDLPYAKAWNLMAQQGRRSRKGATMTMVLKALKNAGFDAQDVSQCITEKTVKGIEQRRLKDCYLVTTASHVLAIKHGLVQDWTSGRLHRIQKVWRIKKIEQ